MSVTTASSAELELDALRPTPGVIRRGLAVMWAEVKLHPRPFAFAVFGSLTYALATVLSASPFFMPMARTVVVWATVRGAL